MNNLSPAEKAILQFWRDFIRTHSDKSVRPMLLYYLMTEMLIKYTTQLPDRPRPSEDAVISIGTTSGSLSKWRKKWHKIWLNLQLE